MDDVTLQEIVEEARPLLEGRRSGKVFQLSGASIAMDFWPGDPVCLLIDANPADPRLYITRRGIRDLEKTSLPNSTFALVLRKQIGGAYLRGIRKDENDRIVRFSFEGRDDLGNLRERTLIAQLTGRTSNILLVDSEDRVITGLRPSRMPGLEEGQIYTPPPKASKTAIPSRGPAFARDQFPTLSEAADDYYRRVDVERAFQAKAGAVRARLEKERQRLSKLRRNLEKDLAAFENSGEDQRIGELLLANLGSAERRGNKLFLVDYHDPTLPRIEIELDEKRSLQEEAGRRFARYKKAKRARIEISRRMAEIDQESSALDERLREIERIIEMRDAPALEQLTGGKKPTVSRGEGSRRPKVESLSGVRRYRSSDGYEVLVGRAAHDNDRLTFRVARPSDLWLHAADYPGSHVIVRNPTRSEVPQRSVIEAAQLAAFFSQARKDTKVVVHYTPKKFLSKPKGAAPGLVRMSSFRSITVEPRESMERL